MAKNFKELQAKMRKKGSGLPKGRKDTVSRGDFYEAARTLEDTMIGVSQGELWDSLLEDYGHCCLLQVDDGRSGAMAVAYLNDVQVRELIQVLKDYLSAKED